MSPGFEPATIWPARFGSKTNINRICFVPDSRRRGPWSSGPGSGETSPILFRNPVRRRRLQKVFQKSFRKQDVQNFQSSSCQRKRKPIFRLKKKINFEKDLVCFFYFSNEDLIFVLSHFFDLFRVLWYDQTKNKRIKLRIVFLLDGSNTLTWKVLVGLLVP